MPGKRTLYASAGVRRIRYDEVESLLSRDMRLQFVDPGIVFGRIHIESAVLHAIRAFKHGKNTCRELRTEILLYLSGERQISTAIKVAGIKRDADRCVMIILRPEKGEPDSLIRKMKWVRDDTILSPEGKDLSKLGISRIETRSADPPEDLVLERVALVDILKGS